MMMKKNNCISNNPRHNNAFVSLSCWRFWSLLWFSVVMNSSTMINVVSGQDPRWVPDYFNETSIDHRHNVCDQYFRYDRGEISLNNSLRGLTLSVVFAKNLHFNPLPNDAIDPLDKGMTLKMLLYVAEKAGFYWEESFAVADQKKARVGEHKDKTLTDLLVWGVNHYDVYANWWSHSVTRLRKGVSYPEGWLDASLIMVGRTDADKDEDAAEKQQRKEVKFFNWMYPFSYIVWLVIVVTLMLSGFVYQLLEYGFVGKGDNWLDQEPVENLYLSAMAGVGQFAYEPNKRGSKIFTWSFAFWTFIITSTYTANLASFFVAKNTATGGINSIDDAIAKNYKFCIWGGSFGHDYILAQYPSADVIDFDTEADAYLGLQQNACNLVITPRATFETFKGLNEINEDCNLVQVGDLIVYASGGFATISDSGRKCTNLVRDVLDLYFIEMSMDGTIDKLWKEYIADTQTNTCNLEGETADADEGGGGDDAVQLGIEEMAGTFVLHAALTVFALVYAFFANEGEEQEEKEEEAESLRMQQQAYLKTKSMSFDEYGGPDVPEGAPQTPPGWGPNPTPIIIPGTGTDEDLKFQVQQINARLAYLMKKCNEQSSPNNFY